MKPINFIKKEGIISNQDEIIKTIVGRLKLCVNGSYEIRITKVSTKRTCPQNRLYRLWLACIADETGNDANDLHFFFKSKFLVVKMGEVFGEKFTKELTTTKLNTKEFTDYLEKINVFASDLGINLPDPEDMGFSEFYETYNNKLF